MSQLAILKAVRDQLRLPVNGGGLGYAAPQCEVQFNGQPPPNCGEVFVAVHPGGWRAEEVEGLAEEFGVAVTVTVRVGKAPLDRMGPNALVGPTGEALTQRLEAIRALLHMDKGAYPVLALANATIGSGANGFVEPLRFLDGGTPQECGPDWFSTDWDGGGRLPPVGIAQTLTFGRAKRYQTVENEQ